MHFPFITFIHCLIFALPLMLTPGPNNLIGIALGKQNGFKANFPFILGVWSGSLCIYLFLCLLGKEFFQLFPKLQLYIIILGSVYMLYLSWNTILAGRQQFEEKKIKNLKLGFLATFAIQWVNPKALVSQITIIAIFKQPTLIGNIIFFSAVSIFVFLSICFWVSFGKSISPLLQKSKKGNFLFHLLLGSSLAVLSMFFMFDSSVKLIHLYS